MYVVPDRLWAVVAVDLFDCLGYKWLICVDYYSEYFEIEKLEKDSTADTVIGVMKKLFATHGIPVKCVSDNGPPFNAGVFKMFETTYGFQHVTSSPYYPQSNGQVEKAVSIAKNILTKCDESETDPYLALLNYRNTPRDKEIGSPAQRLFGRRTRTRLPTTANLLKPKIQTPTIVKEKLESYRQKAKMYYDRNTKPLSTLRAEDNVRVRTDEGWQRAELLPKESQPKEPRSYNVRMPNNRIWRRNRRDIIITNDSNERMNDRAKDSERMSESREQQKSRVGRKIRKKEMDIRVIPKVIDTHTFTKRGRNVRPPKRYSDYVN